MLIQRKHFLLNRFFILIFVIILIVGAVLLSGGFREQNSLQIDVGEQNPWTNIKTNEDFFHFAVVSDRTGKHRQNVFSKAVKCLNLLQPSFVISVGDFIEGYTDDKSTLNNQWNEFQGIVNQLNMPFFYTPGNHDVTNFVEANEWKKRFGKTYYHFVYKNVLFLMLNSDEPYEKTENHGQIGQEQIKYIKKVLVDNLKVSWTIIAMHKPMWNQPNLNKTGWLEVENMLKDRPYTVFCGHMHYYQKFIRNGQYYYQLATTGGTSQMRGISYGEFDHFVWVTMKKDGPVIANLLLEGMLPDDIRK